MFVLTIIFGLFMLFMLFMLYGGCWKVQELSDAESDGRGLRASVEAMVVRPKVVEQGTPHELGFSGRSFWM
jgi:hypothetical protein